MEWKIEYRENRDRWSWYESHREETINLTMYVIKYKKGLEPPKANGNRYCVYVSSEENNILRDYQLPEGVIHERNSYSIDAFIPTLIEAMDIMQEVKDYLEK